MRLIDADKLIKILDMGSGTAIEDALLGIVKSQPTAYDVDKVVEQLEKDAKYFQSEANGLAQVGDFGTATELQGKAAAYRDAVKTVKSGGIE